MNYKTIGKTGLKASILGLGAMRLPMLDGTAGANYRDGKEVDEAASIQLIRTALDSGVNYLDTAYNYLSGMSETITGKALLDGYRDKAIIATKCPWWLIKKPEDFDVYLEKQLNRLQTDHVDMYLFHGVTLGAWKHKILKYNLLEKMSEAKKDGRIGHIGFSFHDSFSAFEEILEAFDWDFCQIQLNYVDSDFQAGIKGMKLAAGKGMGVMIMEPLRGGYLADPPESVRRLFEEADPQRTPVQWALDYLWDMPEVSVVLSGMSTLAQLQENMGYASQGKEGMISPEMEKIYGEAARLFNEAYAIPCTGCNYCTGCPVNITIPYTFMYYNNYFMKGDLPLWKEQYANQLPFFGANADECIACKKCEKKCPQHIKISEWMPKVHALLGE